MPYKIKLTFETGSSLENHIETETLDVSWNNRENVEENISRIQQLEKYYSDYERCCGEAKMELPNFIIKNKFTGYSINLVLDNGFEWQIHPFWIGYFERLKSIEVVDDFFEKIEF